MALLDKSRHYGVVGCASWKLYSQDGKFFDMDTLEEVEPATIRSDEPKPASVLTCKFCGVKRETPELMKEHLFALHKDDMAAAKKKAETPLSDKPEEQRAEPVSEKPKDDAPVTLQSIHKRRTIPKPAPKRRGRPRKKK